jgi:hypothetical protein
VQTTVVYLSDRRQGATCPPVPDQPAGAGKNAGDFRAARAGFPAVVFAGLVKLFDRQGKGASGWSICPDPDHKPASYLRASK